MVSGTGAEGVARDAAALAAYARRCGLIEEGDLAWAYNRLLAACGQTGPGPAPGDAPGGGACDAVPPAPFDLQAVLARLAAAARAAGVALPGRDLSDADFDDALATHLMGILMPRPSQVAARFGALLRDRGPQAATDWFYALCCDAGYVRRAAIARDLKWVTRTSWGDLQITINRSKPEKDPRAIARAAAPRPAGLGAAGEPYPACALCVENEGYAGRGALAEGGARPSRENLRIVPLELGGERWGLQYSPYAYFPEHCIAMSARHEPMRVDRAALGRLLDFVDLLPHYLVGSNAGLPVVGGSILSHEHFQGGRHIFPMELAPIDEPFDLPGFAQVRAGVVRWPLTVLRLACPCARRDELLEAAAHVLQAWEGFDAPEAGVLSRGPDGAPHNAVTPIVRRVPAGGGEAGGPGGDGDAYVMHLALRCNVATPEFPLGLFHPHPELHHIKRENIGLIEVMGLAILPGRLEAELAAVGRALLAGGGRGRLESDPLCAPHAAWALEVAARHPALDEASVGDVLRDEVGQVFARVLEDAGVFKWDAPGRAALRRFLAAL